MKQPTTYSFLHGGGEMGELISSYNWSVNPIGSIEQWPLSLRTLVHMMLTSKFPMLIFWGSELITFYNDAFRPSLGNNGKHPSSLGQRGEESWAESWPVIGPMIYNIMAGGNAVWFEDQKLPIYREGKIDYAYWTYSFSPLTGDNGNVNGILVTCAETTKAVEGLRKLAEAKEQQEMAIEAAELGIWDLNPATGKFTANTRLKEWFGLKHDEEIALPLALNVIDEADRERVAEAVNNSMQSASGGNYEAEYTIVHPRTGKRQIVQAKGKATFDDTGQAERLNGTLRDITTQRMNELAIIEREAHLLSLFEQSPVGIASITGDDLVLLNANPFYGKLAGRLPKDLVGKPLLVAMPELKGQGFDDALRKVMATGIPFTAKEAPVYVKHGNEQVTIYIDHTYQPQRDAKGNITGVLIVVVDITEQVRARKKLEESENLFRSLVEEAPFAIGLYKGEDLVIDIANEAMIKLWGKTAEAVGKTLIEALPELEGQPFIPLLQQVMKSGIPYTAKEQMASLVVDGRLQQFWFNFTYKPLFNAKGDVYGILNMAADVTQQVSNRKQIEESNLFARSIIDNSPVAKIVFLGEDLVIDVVNQHMLELLGRDESVIGKTFSQAMPELSPTSLQERLQKVYNTGETYVQPEERIEIMRYNKPYTGYYNYIHKALRNTTGKIYGIITTATEITNQVLARKKIEEAELKLLAAIEVAELATWSLDVPTGKVTYSSRMQQWLGIEKGMLEPGGSSNVIEQDRQRTLIAVQKALQPGSAGEMDEVYTIVNKQSGQKRIIHVNGKTLFDTDGKPLSLSGTAKDVTVQRKLQLALENEVQTRTEQLAMAFEKIQVNNRELEEVNYQLIQSNEQLAQYAYVASHDLQEPLRKIQIFSEKLIDSGEISQGTQVIVKKIQDSALRMSLLVKDLLNFSRLLKSDDLFHPVDLNKVIHSVLNDYELLVAETKAVFEIDTMPTVKGIEFQMRQLFFNLIGNALKFIIPGTSPEIKITCKKPEDKLVQSIPGHEDVSVYYHITISDNGIGFSQKYAEQIFEIFKRLHVRNKYSGTGIGLALCKKIAENHKGKIYAEGNSVKGACFHVILPAYS